MARTWHLLALCCVAMEVCESRLGDQELETVQQGEDLMTHNGIRNDEKKQITEGQNKVEIKRQKRDCRVSLTEPVNLSSQILATLRRSSERNTEPFCCFPRCDFGRCQKCRICGVGRDEAEEETNVAVENLRSLAN